MEEDLLNASGILQSSLLSALHVRKQPQKQVLYHGKVPNKTQTTQALKSMIKRKAKTKNLRLLFTRAVPETKHSKNSLKLRLRIANISH